MTVTVVDLPDQKVEFNPSPAIADQHADALDFALAVSVL